MKAIRLHLKQNSANYRREETVNCRMTYPLPPYSTVIGALHKACGYTNYHPMQLSIQGKFGSLTRKLFTEDCFLDKFDDDRNTLVKMVNAQALCSAYSIVAKAQISSGSSSKKNKKEGKEIQKEKKPSFINKKNIHIINENFLDEYIKLKKEEQLKKYKQQIDIKKQNLKKMKANGNASPEEIKKLRKKINRHEATYKCYKEKKYTIPLLNFNALVKVPKRYEILCDVELIIHIVSDEQTMQDILDNVCNLTSIGRGEDFVEIVDACETELKCAEEQFINDKYHAYIPCSIIENNNEALKPIEDNEGITTGGTKYLLNKDYALCGEPGKQQRIFNKVPVLYTSRYSLYGKVSGGYVDVCDNDVYAVCLA